MTGRVLLAALLAGWLADRLARPDRDVEAGIEAYEAGELDVALERFEAAIARHGDRPELSLNRSLALLAQSLRTPSSASDPEAAADDGLADAARRAFERASESDDPEVRASAFYERGNVAFDAELWDTAIEAYIECLKARPDHANAKWNLELARLRKQEQEKEDEQDEQEDEQDETGGEDSGSSTGDDSGGTTGDDSGGSTGDDSGGTTGDDSGGSTSDGGSGDQGSSGGGGSGESGGSSGQPPDEGGSGENEPSDDQPPSDEQQQQQQPPPAPQPAPLDQMDLQKALEELDQQDQFILDRPPGGMRPPTEDW